MLFIRTGLDLRWATHTQIQTHVLMCLTNRSTILAMMPLFCVVIYGHICIQGIDMARSPVKSKLFTAWKSHYTSSNYHAVVLMTLYFNYHPCWRSGNNQSEESSALVVSRWLWSGNKTFLEVDSLVESWWIVAFFAQWFLVLLPGISYHLWQWTVCLD